MVPGILTNPFIAKYPDSLTNEIIQPYRYSEDFESIRTDSL